MQATVAQLENKGTGCRWCRHRTTSVNRLPELCWLLGPSVQKSGVCGNMISFSSHTGEYLPILFSQGNLQGAKDMEGMLNCLLWCMDIPSSQDR